MIQRYHNEPVGLRVMPEPGDYLKLHDRILPDGSEQITVGRGGSWSVLAARRSMARRPRPCRPAVQRAPCST